MAQDTENNSFSSSICEFLKEFDIEIDVLTKEQYNVIQLLRYEKKVRISGSAGSGKTLVAVEKAIRLASSGLKVLFLCHNPLLVEKIAGLTKGARVEIVDFCSWINKIISDFSIDTYSDWSHYNEPDTESLNSCLRILESITEKYDAIIVDEGQDFKDEWWMLLEASLKKEDGIFYIFHDNKQSLLDFRSQYPIQNPHIDLSKNCRNAGQIYELMRKYDWAVAETQMKLRGKGDISLYLFDKGNEIEILSKAMEELYFEEMLDDAVVIIGNQENLSNGSLSGKLIKISGIYNRWQDVVREQFSKIFSRYYLVGVKINSGKSPESFLQALDNLSSELSPTKEDVLLVSNLAKELAIDKKTKKKIEENPYFRDAFYWNVEDKNLKLIRSYKKQGVPIWSAEVILFFQQSGWHLGLPKPNEFVLNPYNYPKLSNSLSIYNVADFKGLEANAVVLFVKGKMPRYKETLYVGISRARFKLIIVTDYSGFECFPKTYTFNKVYSK